MTISESDILRKAANLLTEDNWASGDWLVRDNGRIPADFSNVDEELIRAIPRPTLADSRRTLAVAETIRRRLAQVNARGNASALSGPSAWSPVNSVVMSWTSTVL